MRTIVISNPNEVSAPVRDILIENYGFKETNSLNGLKAYKCKNNLMVLSDKSIVNIDNLDIDTELLIFASTHRSESKMPTLSAHAPGVFSDDISMGGQAHTLSFTNSFAIREALLKLKEYNPSNFDISLEVTHHGPYTSKPSLFVELGSSEEQWKIRKMQEVIARTCFELLSSPLKQRNSAIGFGGPHYAPKFTNALFEKEYAFGHICARYAIPFLDKNLVKQMIERTTPKPEYAVFDKKSIRRKSEIKEMLKEYDTSIVEI